MSHPRLASLAGALALAFAAFAPGSLLAHPPTVTLEGQAYSLSDLGPFTPSGAIYFMDGSSSAQVRILATGQVLTVNFTDQSTSIAASAPRVYDPSIPEEGMFVPVPPPLRPVAFFPLNTPDRYRRPTVQHLLQVVSMNMRDEASGSRLLIGLPYAEAYPEIFFDSSLFPTGIQDASSYGVVQALQDAAGVADPLRTVGYPARSFFGIYHILETPLGVFFNKKATQMELQPDAQGKLALTLPPIPFNYQLFNSPIPLFDVQDPHGPPVAEVLTADHGSDSPTTAFSPGSWPASPVNLEAIAQAVKRLRQRSPEGKQAPAAPAPKSQPR